MVKINLHPIHMPSGSAKLFPLFLSILGAAMQVIIVHSLVTSFF
jgi:hypothetical protein